MFVRSIRMLLYLISLTAALDTNGLTSGNHVYYSFKYHSHDMFRNKGQYKFPITHVFLKGLVTESVQNIVQYSSVVLQWKLCNMTLSNN